jgi:putative endopeptidase
MRILERIRMRLSLALSSVLIALQIWSTSMRSQMPVEPAVCQSSKISWGFDVSGMDCAVVPGDDFYNYANGEWNRRTEIPPDRATVGAFPDLRYNANVRVRELLEQRESSAAANTSSSRKAVELYRAYMNEQRVEQLGSKPLLLDLELLRRVRSREQIAETMGSSFKAFGSSLFHLEIPVDDNDATHYSVHVGQGGLGLPNRDYYLQPQFANVRHAYETYITELLHLAKWPDANDEARSIVALETQIAAESWTHAEERDPVKTYNPESLAELERSAPEFPWRQFFRAAGLSDLPSVVVTTNTSVPKLAHIFVATPVKTLKAWQAFHMIDGAAPYLPASFVHAQFAFRSQTLGGQPAMAPRWVRAVGFVNEAMGSAVGELYVQKYFPAESQQQMMALVSNLRAALKDRIEHLSWMSTPTKTEALRKLANLEVQIGRPKVWIDYGALTIVPEALYEDAKREKAFDWQRRVHQMNGLWNKSDWRFWPQYPTAYTENNQLIFTAAMLQSPFFDPKADPAVNYGAIGSVIGHELTHSFDDQGRESDAAGRLRDWWTPDDAARFKTNADLLSTQYSAMEPLPGLHLKGDVTLGENIADLGGVTIALEAYRTSLHAQPAPLLDNFTGDKRFFLGWAQVHREKRRDENLRQMITTDVHSPGTARSNGVVRNIDSWYGAFDVRAVQKLFLTPEQRVRIW